MSCSTGSTKTWARILTRRLATRTWHESELSWCKVSALSKPSAFCKRRGRSEKLTSVSHNRRRTSLPRRQSLMRKRNSSWRDKERFWLISPQTNSRSSRINRSARRKTSVWSSSTQRHSTTSRQLRSWGRALTRRRWSLRTGKGSWETCTNTLSSWRRSFQTTRMSMIVKRTRSIHSKIDSLTSRRRTRSWTKESQTLMQRWKESRKRRRRLLMRWTSSCTESSAIWLHSRVRSRIFRCRTRLLNLTSRMRSSARTLINSKSVR